MRQILITLSVAIIAALGTVSPALAEESPASVQKLERTAPSANATKPLSLAQYAAKRDDALGAARAGGTRELAANCYDVYLKSLGNSRFTSTEISATGSRSAMLRARAAEAGWWEIFTLCFDSTGYDYIYSPAADRYVSARIDLSGDNYGMLRAIAPTVGSWEKFTVSCSSSCTIRSQANNKYVTAEISYTGGGYGMLRTRADSVGSWERFE